MIHPPDSTIPVSVPFGAGRTHIAAMIAAVLRGERSRPLEAATGSLLLTPAEAARKLRCSIKTLNAHVESGALRYVSIGHGKKRMKRMFTRADLDEFVLAQTRKDSPCPSTRIGTVARRSGTSTSNCEVIGFTALQKRRTSAKPRK
jgi:hypothetical protein